MPTTLVPGLLVSLKTTVTGNVSYFKREIESDRLDADGSTKATWETTRKIADLANHEAAGKARSEARTAITRVCIASAFGLLCPQDRETDLEEAIREARRIADAFNETSTCSTLRVYAITGRIASNDQEAIRAINSEVQDLIEQMASGIESKNVASIREAANRAKQLGAMLSVDAAAKVQLAIDQSRAWAREAQASLKNDRPVQVDTATVARVRGASVLFMDEEPVEPMAAPRSRQAALDMGA